MTEDIFRSLEIGDQIVNPGDRRGWKVIQSPDTSHKAAVCYIIVACPLNKHLQFTSNEAYKLDLQKRWTPRDSMAFAR